ncbi:MAG: hypothetical protein AB8G99_17530 [Planctomycetaceae bacterium]
MENQDDTGMPLADPLLEIISDYQAGGITASDCVSCSSPCCAHGGFAILENVQAIYSHYTEGNLNRSDYEFQPGLSFSDFVLEYFDVYRYDVPETSPAKSIVLFCMRSLSSCGNTVSIPPMSTIFDYYRAREAFFKSNGWMNGGCVCLSHRLDSWPAEDELSSRHCILHSDEASNELTKKPIDCVFHTCDTPRNARHPTREQSMAWFAELAEQWPNSVERFRQLVTQDGPR